MIDVKSQTRIVYHVHHACITEETVNSEHASTCSSTVNRKLLVIMQVERLHLLTRTVPESDRDRRYKNLPLMTNDRDRDKRTDAFDSVRRALFRLSFCGSWQVLRWDSSSEAKQNRKSRKSP